jgi:hypothetical protein
MGMVEKASAAHIAPTAATAAMSVREGSIEVAEGEAVTLWAPR